MAFDWRFAVTLFLGGALVLVTHVLTMRSMSEELAGWRSLGHSLTETAERCVGLLPHVRLADEAIRKLR